MGIGVRLGDMAMGAADQGQGDHDPPVGGEGVIEGGGKIAVEGAGFDRFLVFHGTARDARISRVKGFLRDKFVTQIDAGMAGSSLGGDHIPVGVEDAERGAARGMGLDGEGESG